jgi:uncharacterized protein YbcV (DUF1398 family)
MFSTEGFRIAKAKVKDRAGFPEYVDYLKNLGISYYENFLEYGEAHYYSKNGFKSSIGRRYVGITVADKSDRDLFLQCLHEFDEAKFDYLTFCNHCANCGIEKWIVSIDNMTTTYYNKVGEEIYTESIPANAPTDK